MVNSRKILVNSRQAGAHMEDPKPIGQILMEMEKLTCFVTTPKVTIGPNFRMVMVNSRRILESIRLVGVDTAVLLPLGQMLMVMEMQICSVTISRVNIGPTFQLVMENSRRSLLASSRPDGALIVDP
jgi:hypothetical protein